MDDALTDGVMIADPAEAVEGGVVLRLPYRPPYDWAGVRGFLAARAIPGVEALGLDGPYARTIVVDDRHGSLTILPDPARDHLCATVFGIDPARLPAVEARLRHLFDCDADPGTIAGRLGQDPDLAHLLVARPGLRLPGAWDPFETGCRAILGQQVSVAAAVRLAGKLVAAFGAPFRGGPSPTLTHVFPTPKDLAEADVALALNMPRARGAAIRALAQAALADPDLFAPTGTLAEAVGRFTVLRGIGPWTAQYIALRALKLPDALPVGDVGLLRALDRGTGRPSPAALLLRAESWRPFRAYAAQHLWAADASAAQTTGDA